MGQALRLAERFAEINRMPAGSRPWGRWYEELLLRRSSASAEVTDIKAELDYLSDLLAQARQALQKAGIPIVDRDGPHPILARVLSDLERARADHERAKAASYGAAAMRRAHEADRTDVMRRVTNPHALRGANGRPAASWKTNSAGIARPPSAFAETDEAKSLARARRNAVVGYHPVYDEDGNWTHDEPLFADEGERSVLDITGEVAKLAPWRARPTDRTAIQRVDRKLTGSIKQTARRDITATAERSARKQREAHEASVEATTPPARKAPAPAVKTGRRAFTTVAYTARAMGIKGAAAARGSYTSEAEPTNSINPGGKGKRPANRRGSGRGRGKSK